MNLSVRFSQVLPILLTTGILAISTPAQAQTINGIFGTRSSEQFFLEGIERLEQEIDELQNDSDPETDILTIDPSIEEQRQSIEQQGMSQEDWFPANATTGLQPNQDPG
ncbi:MAG: hypothetical protein AAGD25_23395 [Cyanobacteria bacterium P01_F01_bin.150]